MINGMSYDWESVEIILPSGIAIGIQNITYKDERPVEPRYGKGSVPRGYGRKNYKADGSMELDMLEAEMLQAALGMSYYDSPPFPIVVIYADEGRATVADTLPQCKITKVDSGGKQGDDAVGVRKFDFVILSPILWGDVGALAAVGSFMKEKLSL